MQFFLFGVVGSDVKRIWQKKISQGILDKVEEKVDAVVDKILEKQRKNQKKILVFAENFWFFKNFWFPKWSLKLKTSLFA